MKCPIITGEVYCDICHALVKIEELQKTVFQANEYHDTFIALFDSCGTQLLSISREDEGVKIYYCRGNGASFIIHDE